MKIKKLLLLCFTTLLLTSCGTKQEMKVDKKQEENVRPDSFMLSTDKYDFYFEDLDSDIIKEETIDSGVSELERFVRTNLTKKEEAPLEFNKVIKDINNKKYDHAKKNSQDMKKHTPDEWYGSKAYRSEGSKLLTQSEFDMMHNSHYPGEPNVIDKSEAKEDVILLDRLFRSFYGPYKQFGRENFNKALEENLSFIDSQSSYLIGNFLFQKQIIKSYSFIRDIHTQVRGIRFEDTFRLKETGYYFDDYFFMKDDKGYYLKDYSPKVYLTSVNEDSSLDNYLHYGITRDGELAYMISFYDLEKKKNHNINIVLDDKTFEIKVEQMNAIDKYFEVRDIGRRFNENHKKEISSLTLVDGYPVVAMRTYSFRYEDVANYPTYFKAGKELRNDNVVIHDTRCNGGGSMWNVNSFYTNLTGYDYDEFYISGDYSSKKEDLYGITFLKKVYARDFVIDGYDNLLFTLTDNGSGSCGDGTVEYTKAYKNGIVVGEPTEGAMLGGDNLTFELPNSKFNIYMSYKNQIEYSYDNYPDGIGIDPDIWVNSEEALDKLVKCLEYYDIKPSPNSKDVVDRIGYGTNDIGRVDLSIEKEEAPLEYNYIYRIEEVTDDDTSFQIKASKYLKGEEEPLDSNYFTLTDYNSNSSDDFISDEVSLFGTSLKVKIYNK